MGDIGSIVFGPRTTEEERRKYDKWADMFATAQQADINTRLCHCVGPQPGERLCPCRLAAEANKGAQMVKAGVVINGVHYDLVPSKKP